MVNGQYNFSHVYFYLLPLAIVRFARFCGQRYFSCIASRCGIFIIMALNALSMTLFSIFVGHEIDGSVPYFISAVFGLLNQ
jgi:hypothetical protein